MLIAAYTRKVPLVFSLVKERVIERNEGKVLVVLDSATNRLMGFELASAGCYETRWAGLRAVCKPVTSALYVYFASPSVASQRDFPPVVSHRAVFAARRKVAFLADWLSDFSIFHVSRITGYRSDYRTVTRSVGS